MPEKTWLQTWWPQILFFLGLGALGVKNQVDTQRTKKAVFDSDGQSRIMTVKQCEKHISNCEKRHEVEKSEMRQEMQNIHTAIAELNQSIAEIPNKMIDTMAKIKGLNNP